MWNVEDDRSIAKILCADLSWPCEPHPETDPRFPGHEYRVVAGTALAGKLSHDGRTMVAELLT
jgi:hypothetical protein